MICQEMMQIEESVNCETMWHQSFYNALEALWALWKHERRRRKGKAKSLKTHEHRSTTNEAKRFASQKQAEDKVA